MGAPERIIPAQTARGILAIHLNRYEFALEACRGARVLDAACGVGYGSAALAEVAEHVVGIDLSEEAVGYARVTYARANTEFLVMDVQRLGFPPRSFDVVCSFETLEHVAEPEAAIAEAARVLRPGGRYILSTPRVDETTHEPANPFHTVELSRPDLESMLLRHFDSVHLFGQVRAQTARHRLLRRLDVLGLRKRFGVVRRLGVLLTGTPAMDRLGTEDLAISEAAADTADDILGICSAPKLAQPA